MHSIFFSIGISNVLLHIFLLIRCFIIYLHQHIWRPHFSRYCLPPFCRLRKLMYLIPCARILSCAFRIQRNSSLRQTTIFERWWIHVLFMLQRWLYDLWEEFFKKHHPLLGWKRGRYYFQKPPIQNWLEIFCIGLMYIIQSRAQFVFYQREFGNLFLYSTSKILYLQQIKQKKKVLFWEFK